MPVRETTDDHLSRQLLRLPDGTPLHADVPKVLNALFDDETVPHLVLWRRPGEAGGTWWVAGDPDGLAAVALALMTPPRKAWELRWFLDPDHARSWKPS